LRAIFPIGTRAAGLPSITPARPIPCQSINDGGKLAPERVRASDGDRPVSAGFEDARVARRTLAGATILQIVSALREEPGARAAINIAYALLQAGARALIAAEGGPLASELRGFGGEWIDFPDSGINPFRLRRNARLVEELIAAEGVDIVHAQSPGGAWSARIAAARIAVWLVTTLPDVPPRGRAYPAFVSALAQGDRIIAPSIYAASPLIARYRIPRDQITIIPREIDTDVFDPMAVAPGRTARLRAQWQIPAGDRIVLAPGRVAPWNGQDVLPEVARTLNDEGVRGVSFAIVGEHATHRGYAREIMQRAQELGVGRLFRMTGHCADLPAALLCADFVVVPAVEPPLLGSVVAQAQAMARPAIVSAVGMLPEHVLTPPRMPEELRTGWVVTPGAPTELTRTLKLALALEAAAYEAMSARAREFAKYMFSHESAAAAMREVYTSLLAREL
jgi:glycosyltransferase involved in cell wall biosynthesis